MTEPLLTAEDVVGQVWELIAGRVRIPPAAIDVVKLYARQQVTLALNALDCSPEVKLVDERSKVIDLAIGRLLRLGSRAEQPGDLEEYARLRKLLLELAGERAK